MTTTEWCPWCEKEVEISGNEKSRCPECGKEILPCSTCNENCDWDVDRGCRRFPKQGGRMCSALKRIYIMLPPPAGYGTVGQWLEAVRRAVERAGFEVNIATMHGLWQLARDTVRWMDDMFWGVDDHDPCAYCREPEGCPNAYRVGPGEYRPRDPGSCPEWPGRRASERLAVICTARVLESLLVCYCASRKIFDR